MSDSNGKGYTVKICDLEDPTMTDREHCEALCGNALDAFE